MNILLFILYGIVIFYFIYKVGSNLVEQRKITLPLLFGIKLLVGIFFLYVYTYHYGGGELTADAGKFFEEGKTLHDVFAKSPKDYFSYLFGLDNSPEFVNKHLSSTNHWNGTNQPLLNDSQNVIRINSLIFFLSQGQVLTHILIMCLVSFIGMLEIYKWTNQYCTVKKGNLLIFLMLIPSPLFWSSSFLKEPFMILGFGLLTRLFFDNKLTLKQKLLRLSIGLPLMLMFKPYVFLCFIPAILFYLFSKYLFPKRLVSSIFLFTVLGLTIFFIPQIEKKVVHKISKQQTDFINVGLGGLHIYRNDSILYFPGLNRDKMEMQDELIYLRDTTEGYYVSDKKNYAMESIKIPPYTKPWNLLYQSKGSASQFQVTRINHSTSNLIKIIPKSLLNALMRPFPGDNGTWLIYLAMLENFAIVILFGFIFFFRRNKKINTVEKRVITTLFIFSISLLLIIGLTTPVSGAIVRYKIPAVISLCIIMAMIYQPKSKIK